LLLVPVDSLTITNSSSTVATVSLASKQVVVGKLQFRWDYILIYVFLRSLQGGGIGEFAIVLIKMNLIFVLVTLFKFS